MINFILIMAAVFIILSTVVKLYIRCIVKQARLIEKSGVPWSIPFSSRCRSRLKRYEYGSYWGRCELQRHSQEETEHCLERGMVWVRWIDYGVHSKYRLEEPHYDR